MDSGQPENRRPRQPLVYLVLPASTPSPRRRQGSVSKMHVVKHLERHWISLWMKCKHVCVVCKPLCRLALPIAASSPRSSLRAEVLAHIGFGFVTSIFRV